MKAMSGGGRQGKRNTPSYAVSEGAALTDDAPIDDVIYTVAVAAQHLLTVAEALALQYGEATARGALLVAYAVLGERTLGHEGMRDELRVKIAALTENPTIAEAVSRWLH
jgi:hypothetical protein